MSILDDAIREHLELKRAHGADESELKRLEDEAFGPPQRPEGDPFAEAPTEFLGVSEAAREAGTAVAEPGGRRVPNIADLQEAPPAQPVEEAEEEMPPDVLPPPPEAEERPEEAAPVEPALEEQPAVEQPLPGEPADAGPSTEERQAIAEQPTQFFDVEADIEEPAPPAETPGPTEDELADAEASEPRLGATPQPTPGPEPEIADEAPSEEYEEDDFFSEQRLSDELDQALEAPVTDEHEVLPAEPAEEETREEHEGPISEEYEEGEYETGEEEQPPPPRREPGHEDVLEDTPDFLEDGEDDDLWFEQRPPKDFDFDD